MGRALAAARRAAAAGEVPVGAVIVSRSGKFLGSGRNRREQDSDPTAHAELVALRRACRRSRNWRLPGATVYVTLEPCLMCLMALKNARVARVVYGASDPKRGAARWGGLDIPEDGNLNPVRCEGGLDADAAGPLLKAFFRDRRRKAGS
ncbi:MAG: nucleoside deaminase [Deltaproteobacteria bacterium]|nr:nucleoside deaminase [Deltaproteobacteria bacterium]